MSNRRGVSPEFIAKVKTANGIVPTAGRYIQLKQKGRTHWACCPFHHEKTPSFAINEQGQFYHCFGCGVSGDVITLVQQLEGLDFYGAVEFLARNASIEMPAEVMDVDYANIVKKKRRILAALEEVCKYYCDNLHKPANKQYKDYLLNRGITEKLIKMFNIGVCSDWDSSIRHLKNFSKQELVDAGIAQVNKSGTLYDTMGVRITFAVFNVYGDCIGFSGRSIADKEDVAKYKNTSQTMVFDKSNIVYGIDVLKKNKLSNFVDKLFVVEGNVDAIMMHGAGFGNTVACMGTALTQFHAKVFARFSDKIYICFDGDDAGQKATLKGLEILENERLEVRVVSFPDKMDPDDFLRKHGADEFRELVDNALPLTDFKLNYLQKQNSLKDNLDKTKYINAAVEILRPLQGTPQLELYVKRVAEAGGVSFDSVVRAVNKEKTDKVQSSRVERSEATISAYSRALDFYIASLLHSKNFAKVEDIKIENKLYERLIKKINESDSWKVSNVFDEFDDGDIKQLDKIINFDFKEGLAKEYDDSVKYLVNHEMKNKKEELLERYKQTENTQEKMEIMKQIQEINKRIKK